MSTYTAIGSVCWDTVEGEDRPRLGGSVLFAARVAHAQGMAARIITSGTPALEAALVEALPDAAVTVQPSTTDTVMVYRRAADLGPQAVPTRAAPIRIAPGEVTTGPGDVIHLAPIMGEITRDVVAAVAGAHLVGMTPQGMLRVTDDEGTLLRLPHLDPWWVHGVDAVVLSEHEHHLVDDPAALTEVALAVTRGERGCIGRHHQVEVDLPGLAVGDVTPVHTIGAGDVFAAAFFIALASGAEFEAALDRANRTAAAHVAGTDAR